MTVSQPFQYQGSQRALAPLILQYLPISTTRLVEPFCGSAADWRSAAVLGGGLGRRPRRPIRSWQAPTRGGWRLDQGRAQWLTTINQYLIARIAIPSLY